MSSSQSDHSGDQRHSPTSDDPAMPMAMLHGRHQPGTKAHLVSYEQTLEMYRQNAKKSNDPHVQLEFAKYLIEIAQSIPLDDPDPSTRRAYDTLVAEGVKWMKRLAGGGMGKSAYAEAQFLLYAPSIFSY